MAQTTLKVTVALVTILCISTTQINGGKPDSSSSPFKQEFNNCLASSNDALQQFDVAMPPYIAYNVFYKLALRYYSAVKAPNAKDIAQRKANVAQYKIACVTPNQYADLCSSGIEKILDVEGILTNKNAASLAAKYVKYLEQARKGHRFNGSPQANLKSLYDGTQNFLKDTVHFTSNTAEVVFHAFQDNLKALPCCCAVADN